MHQENQNHSTIYSTVWYCELGKSCKNQKYIILDFLICSEFIPRRRCAHWIEREGFKIRKLLILKWLLLGNVITIAYKSNLHSSLITIRYEGTIDTLNDLVDSDLGVLLPNNTPTHMMFASDPRPTMKKIYKKSHVYPYHGTPPSYAWKMWVKVMMCIQFKFSIIL